MLTLVAAKKNPVRNISAYYCTLGSFIIFFQDMRKILNASAPCIVVFGASRNDIEDIKINIETDTIIPVANMATAIHFGFACF